MSNKVVNNTGSVRLNSVDRFARYNANRFTVAGNILPFARSTSIFFSAEGLKPNKRYYPFFNGIYVGKYCIIDTKADGEITAATPSILLEDGEDSALITDQFGRMKGVFFLPADTFLAGRHKFMLVDSINNTSSSYILPSQDSVSASAIYEVDGLHKNKSLGVLPDSKMDTRAEVTSPGDVTASVPPITCELRYFEYIISKSESKLFSILSNSQEPPDINTVRPDFGNSSIRYSITYISTVVVKSGLEFKHIYSASTIGSSTTASKIFRQEWVGLSDIPLSDMPSLAGFRPSGISEDSIVTIITPWTVSGSAACPINLGFGEAVFSSSDKFDPLAQSFFIKSGQYPSGVFISSIGLYFNSVDQNSPVTVEIRDMDSNLPGSSILPNGVSTLPGVAVIGSDDSSVSTTFRFRGLVYLAPDKEYCFVVKTPSLGYSLWFSRVGETDLLSNRTVDTTNFDGTLFKNDYNSSWIPDLYEDIKFDLNVAAFNSTAKELRLKPRTVTKGGVTFHVGGFYSLPLHNITTVNGDRVVIVRIPDHQLNSADFISISGVKEGLTINGIPSDEINGDHVVVSVVDKDTVSIRLQTEANINGPLRSSFERPKITVIPQDVPQDPTISGILRFIGDTSKSPAIVPSGDLTPIPTPLLPEDISAETSFLVQANYRVDEALIDYIGVDIDGATSLIEEIRPSYRTSSGSFASGTNVNVLNRLSDLSFATPAYLVSPRNEQKYNVGSFDVRMRFTSSNKYVSPVVDGSTTSLVAKSYRINDQFGEIDNIFDSSSRIGELKERFNDVERNSEIGRKSGNAYAKYKSPISVVDNTFYKKVILSVRGNATFGSALDAYIRVSSDYNTHEDYDWNWMPLDGIYTQRFIPCESKSEIKEWVYEIDLGDGFITMDFKLVMRTVNSSIPKIHSIQAITI